MALPSVFFAHCAGADADAKCRRFRCASSRWVRNAKRKSMEKVVPTTHANRVRLKGCCPRPRPALRRPCPPSP